MNLMTVDLEDWFHILENKSFEKHNWRHLESRLENNTWRLLSAFSKYNIKATFFSLGWVAESYPEILKSIVDAGHEIGTHSHMHDLAHELSAGEFEDDLLMSMEAIYKATGVTPKYYRAPGFSIVEKNLKFLNLLVKNGIEADFSIFSGSRAHGGLNSCKITKPSILVLDCEKQLLEFPMSMVEFLMFKFAVTGGGYFRLAPSLLVKRVVKNSKYNMFYFHPRDFDPGQPIPSGLNIKRKFKNRVGLKTSEKKLEKILRSTKFDDLAMVLENQSSFPQYRLSENKRLLLSR